MRKPTSMKSILNPKPSTVKTSKKKSVKKASNMVMPATASVNKSVNIEKAGNGYTVSTWDGDNTKKMVAKSHAEMMRHVKGMMGG